MNTDLIITLRTVLTLCVLVVLEAETISHFFMHCHYYPSIRLTLFKELCETDMNLPNLSEDKFLNIILYGSSFLSDTPVYFKFDYKVYSRFKTLQWVYFLKL